MHDHRRNLVPITNEAALTAVQALAERFVGDGPTSRTRRACTAWLNLDQLDPGSLSLVVEHRSECCPCGIVNIPRQIRAIGEHWLNLQVFNRDAVVSLNKIMRNLMQVVTTLIGDALVSFGKLMHALRSALGIALAAGNRALTAAHLTQCAFRPVWPHDRITGGQSNEFWKAEIDTDAALTLSFANRDLDVKDHVPFAVLAGEDCRCRFARQHAMPANAEFAGNANNTELAVLAQGKAITNARISVA